VKLAGQGVAGVTDSLELGLPAVRLGGRPSEVPLRGRLIGKLRGDAVQEAPEHQPPSWCLGQDSQTSVQGQPNHAATCPKTMLGSVGRSVIAQAYDQTSAASSRVRAARLWTSRPSTSLAIW